MKGSGWVGVLWIPALASSGFAASRQWMEFGVFAIPVAENSAPAGPALRWEREGQGGDGEEVVPL